MNDNLQAIVNFLSEDDAFMPELKQQIMQAVKIADKQLAITEFKLGRTEKEKKAVSNLLEETIGELQQKSLSIKESNAALLKSLDNLKSAQAH